MVKNSKTRTYLCALIALTILLIYLSYSGSVNKINATMLAFTYEYGFISRGFIGSVYHLFDLILPFDLMNYGCVQIFTQTVTLCFYLLLFVFFMHVLSRASVSLQATVKQMSIFYLIFAVPMFANTFNFGRLDLYCVAISILCAMLIVSERAVWLVVPLSAISVMIHQGNVFMYMNIILVLLLYRALCAAGKRRKKYFILLAVAFATVSVLFLYFECFSHFNGDNIYEEIVADATRLCENGEYHEDVVDHEILGVDLSSREILYRKKNTVEFPIFVVLMLPYIIFSVRFFTRLVRVADKKEQKWAYRFVAIGSLTIVPDLLLKCDYGRWMFAIISYYSVVMLSLLAMRDSQVERILEEQKKRLMDRFPGAVFLLGYPLLFIPFGDVAICGLTYNLADKINELLLHWW